MCGSFICDISFSYANYALLYILGKMQIKFIYYIYRIDQMINDNFPVEIKLIVPTYKNRI